MEPGPFSAFFDACAGIGCFHSGIVNSAPETKFECVGMAEIETHLRGFYLDNFGKQIPNFGSVHLLSGTVKPSTEEEEQEFESWKNLEITKGTILTAGFPCQPFSKAGQQQGFKDKTGRGNLFFNICKKLTINNRKTSFLNLTYFFSDYLTMISDSNISIQSKSFSRVLNYDQLCSI